ncbi:outer membrane beta-barrel protein [Winogradskyella sp. F6397]|uniref:Outer membrane beta-barrel protein n=1 Tax=Winogradskyella marina TaxID=2785530 RepID=A0ABS0EF87_9FLAO|nr:MULTISPECIES: outer membrane beta-barrel protein [Winogradskyella]MBF8149123.1 outer membrane beta-barrel protein [Winogradskyella marina]
MTLKSLCLGVFIAVLAPFVSNAQDQTKLGGYLAYGTEIENIGIGVNAEFPIADQLTIAPSFTYFLPKDEFGVKVNWFELNGNVNYYFVDSSNISVYGLGGLNYSSVKVSYDDAVGFGGDFSASDGRFGLNLGGGANFEIGSNILPFAELKYVIIDGGQLVIAAGVKFNI